MRLDSEKKVRSTLKDVQSLITAREREMVFKSLSAETSDNTILKMTPVVYIENLVIFCHNYLDKLNE